MPKGNGSDTNGSVRIRPSQFYTILATLVLLGGLLWKVFALASGVDSNATRIDSMTTARSEALANHNKDDTAHPAMKQCLDKLQESVNQIKTDQAVMQTNIELILKGIEELKKDNRNDSTHP